MVNMEAEVGGGLGDRRAFGQGQVALVAYMGGNMTSRCPRSQELSLSLSDLKGWTLGHGKPWKQKLVVDLGIGGPLGKAKWL